MRSCWAFCSSHVERPILQEPVCEPLGLTQRRGIKYRAEKGGRGTTGVYLAMRSHTRLGDQTEAGYVGVNRIQGTKR